MTAESIATLPIEALAPRLREGELSAVTLVDAVLARIARHDGELKAYRELSLGAVQAARAADREIAEGRYRGPLHGIPVALKDNFLTADMPSCLGVDLPPQTFPRRDAVAVRRLREAGAIIIGKTQMHGFAWGIITPPTRNPWDRDRVPGGSSGGSAAAVVAGLCGAALGSDTGGSVRIPASLCGCVGFKPTYGLIDKDGIVTHSWSLDVAGPLARTVGDAALMLEALAGPGYAARLGQPIAGLRIGVCRQHFFDRNAPEVQNAVETAVAHLAGRCDALVEVELPHLPYGLGAILAIELASCTAGQAELLRRGMQKRMPEDVRTLLELGAFVSGADYLRAEQVRRLLMEDFRAAFAVADVIITPTTPVTAWPHGETNVPIGDGQESILSAAWRLTYPFNLVGLPAITLPCGFDSRGLPIGLQIAGKPHSENTVLSLAHAYEEAHDWTHRRPDLA
jgi:aspartyl-tRNA(Asn)/glutamyl-tRNA(Gln) amidotransferase subunit A